uniref:Hexosyltransferase n=1 Tax=Zea mays TaxID=4577 RepID=A0A804LJA4_MAIZE
MSPELTGKMAAKAAAAAAAVKPATRAYVTFLAGDGDYWKGVVGLAKGLRKVGSAYPLVVALLPDVPESHRRILVSQGCILREIEPVYPPENQTQFAMAYYVINYSKLRIWEFVEYERMVYLDADIQVFENIDELFELEKGYFYAVMDCFCEKTWSHTPQYRIGYCQQCPDKVAWPTTELGPPPPLYFNAGMFAHEPSMATAKAPRERPAGEGEGRALLRGGVQAVEVHGQGGQHGQGGHQDAGEQVVGHLQRRGTGLQGPAPLARRRRRRGGGGGQEAAPRGAGGGRHGQVRHRALGRVTPCFGFPPVAALWLLRGPHKSVKKNLTIRPLF